MLPHILFLMADQLRFDAIGGLYPHGANTPNLARLAARGVALDNAYTTTPTCTPARSAILTGLSPWYHGMLGYGTIAPKYPFEMPSALASAGYRTAVIGKGEQRQAQLRTQRGGVAAAPLPIPSCPACVRVYGCRPLWDVAQRLLHRPRVRVNTDL